MIGFITRGTWLTAHCSEEGSWFCWHTFQKFKYFPGNVVHQLFASIARTPSLSENITTQNVLPICLRLLDSHHLFNHYIVGYRCHDCCCFISYSTYIPYLLYQPLQWCHSCQACSSSANRQIVLPSLDSHQDTVKTPH